MPSETLQMWDYVVIVLMLIISTSIGFYYRFTGGRQKTSEVIRNPYTDNLFLRYSFILLFFIH